MTFSLKRSRAKYLVWLIVIICGLIGSGMGFRVPCQKNCNNVLFAETVTETLYQKPNDLSTLYLKDVLRRAKIDKSLLGHAIASVKECISECRIVNIHGAMTSVSIFKLAGMYDESVNLLTYMRVNNIPPDTYFYNNIIDGFARQKDWKSSIRLLEEMKCANIKRDMVSYSTAISACEKAGQWEVALKLFHQMAEEGVPKDTICFSSVISAVASGGQVNVPCIHKYAKHNHAFIFRPVWHCNCYSR